MATQKPCCPFFSPLLFFRPAPPPTLPPSSFLQGGKPWCRSSFSSFQDPPLMGMYPIRSSVPVPLAMSLFIPAFFVSFCSFSPADGWIRYPPPFLGKVFPGFSQPFLISQSFCFFPLFFPFFFTDKSLL